MNGFSRAFLVGAGVIGLGIAQPDFTQDMGKLGTGIQNNPMKNTRGKVATFEASNGSYVGMIITLDTYGNDMLTMGMDLSPYVIAATYTRMKSGIMGFVVFCISEQGTGVFMGSGGKLISWSPEKIPRELAEGMYINAICTIFATYEDARKNGRMINSQLSQTQIDKIYRIFGAEEKKCRPMYDKNYIQPQKYNAPKKESDPLYRSANYRESVLRAENAMKAKEIRKPGMQAPFRIRNGLVGRV